MTAKVSVIVPVYNVESHIRGCLDSIAAQTYKNLEIILSDDGSEDGSGRICAEFAARDRRARVLRFPNGGLSMARNRALDAAEGDYIMFADSDDRLTEDAVEFLLGSIEKSGADMAMGGFAYSRGGALTPMPALTVPEGIITADDFWRYFRSDERTFYVTVWAKLYKRRVWEGLRFPAGKLHEDEFMAHRITDRCRKIAVSKKTAYLYTVRGGSIMTGPYSPANLDAAEGMLERCAYFIGKKKYGFAMDALETAMYSILCGCRRLQTADNDRVRELHAAFAPLCGELLGRNVPLKSKIKCGIFRADIRAALKILR